jgi:hypothetical protein
MERQPVCKANRLPRTLDLAGRYKQRAALRVRDPGTENLNLMTVKYEADF